ncbi:hypothetical protein [Pseudomonas fulva]
MKRNLCDCLGYLVVGPECDSEGKLITNLSLIQRLDLTEAEAIASASTDLYFFSSGEDLYNCVQKNMEDFIKAVVEFASRYFDSGGMTEDNMASASLEFSRLMLNMLSMFKSFLDHGKAALNKRYGASSVQSESWQKAQSVEFDRSVAYRLFYNLRNYAQHVGMPPIHFSLEQKSGDDSVGVRLEFHKSELLEKYSDWSSQAKIDLRSGNEQIPIFGMLEEWSACFHRLAKFIQDMRRSEVLASAKLVASIREKYGIPNGAKIVVMPEPKLSESGGLGLNFRGLPEQQARQIVENVFIKKFDAY